MPLAVSEATRKIKVLGKPYIREYLAWHCAKHSADRSRIAEPTYWHK